MGKTAKKGARDAERSRQRLLTCAQFCERLGMSLVWGRKMIQRRGISYVKVGRRAVRIPESEIERITSERFVPAVKERSGATA